MIRGKVIDNEPVVTLKVTGPNGSIEISAVVDTGYTKDITLPPPIVRKLRLKWKTDRELILGDGSVRTYNCYFGSIRWGDRTLQIEIDESEGDCLLGAGLLKGFELNIQFRRNGRVTIHPLARK